MELQQAAASLSTVAGHSTGATAVNRLATNVVYTKAVHGEGFSKIP